MASPKLPREIRKFNSRYWRYLALGRLSVLPDNSVAHCCRTGNKPPVG